MNKIIVLFLLMLIFTMLSCDKDTRASFMWKGTIDGEEKSWFISCDNECAECRYKIGGGDYGVLSKSAYKAVYDKCADLPKADKVPEPTKTDVTPSINEGGLKIKSAGTGFFWYGFDDWRTYKSETEKVSYMSIKANGSAYFEVELGSEYFDDYAKVIAYLPDAASKGLSFSANEVVDEKVIDKATTWHMVEVFASSSAPKGIPLDVFIMGYDDPKDRACLAGDCGEYVEDVLKVIVYDERLVTNNKLIVLGNSVFNPSAWEFENGHNTILVQAVCKIANVNKKVFPDITAWDKNVNNKLDMFASGENVPFEKNELGLLLESLDAEIGGSLNNLFGSTMIVPNEINTHYYVTENANVGDFAIYLNFVDDDVAVDDEIYIGPWLGGEGDYEWVIVTAVDAIINRIEVCQKTNNTLGLLKDHPIGHTFYKNETIGVNIGSCSIVQSKDMDYASMTHEFLHQDIMGDFQHVKDNANVMYPSVKGSTGAQLRCRPIALYDGGTEPCQWNKLH